MVVDSYITIEELNDKFREKIKSLNIKFRDYVLVYNSIQIDKKSQMKLKDYFKKGLSGPHIPIMVTFC